MPNFLMEIIFALARAALATFLAKELYSITIPSLVVFSFLTLSLITRDPLRDSLPPVFGLRDVFGLFMGRRRSDRESRSIVRLSIFSRDVFWVSRTEVLQELLAEEKVRPIFYGNGIIMPYGDKERNALENVSSCGLSVLTAGQVFTTKNLAKFNDVIDEEERFFVGKVSKAQVMTLPLIHEFVSRTLQRMIYGMCVALLPD
jgi:hypothetical protein